MSDTPSNLEAERPVDFWRVRFLRHEVPIACLSVGDPTCVVFEPACDGFNMRVKRNLDGRTWIEWFKDDESDPDGPGYSEDPERLLSVDDRALMTHVESLSSGHVLDLARMFCGDQISTLLASMEGARRRDLPEDQTSWMPDALRALLLIQAALAVGAEPLRSVALRLTGGFAGTCEELLEVAGHLVGSPETPECK